MVIFIYFYYLTGRAESILSCTDAANLLKRSVSKTSSATCCSNGESLQSHSSLNPTIRAPISVLSFHKVGAILPYQNEQNYRSASSYFFPNFFFLFSNLGGPPPEALHTTLLWTKRFECHFIKCAEREQHSVATGFRSMGQIKCFIFSFEKCCYYLPKFMPKLRKLHF